MIVSRPGSVILRERVLASLRRGPLTVRELADELGAGTGSLDLAIRHLRASGQIEVGRRGLGRRGLGRREVWLAQGGEQ